MYLTKTIAILPGLNEIQFVLFITKKNVLIVSSENFVQLTLLLVELSRTKVREMRSSLAKKNDKKGFAYIHEL